MWALVPAHVSSWHSARAQKLKVLEPAPWQRGCARHLCLCARLLGELPPPLARELVMPPVVLWLLLVPLANAGGTPPDTPERGGASPHTPEDRFEQGSTEMNADFGSQVPPHSGQRSGRCGNLGVRGESEEEELFGPRSRSRSSPSRSPGGRRTRLSPTVPTHRPGSLLLEQLRFMCTPSDQRHLVPLYYSGPDTLNDNDAETAATSTRAPVLPQAQPDVDDEGGNTDAASTNTQPDVDDEGGTRYRHHRRAG